MTPWMGAVDKLRSLGYAVTLDGERLRYAHKGRGNPSQDEIALLLDVLRTYRGRILNDPYFLIEQTFGEINKAWKAGTLKWMKRNRPDDWRKMFYLEEKINGFTLKNDVEELKKALEEYMELMLGEVQRRPNDVLQRKLSENK